jgi:hypothetical protein
MDDVDFTCTFYIYTDKAKSFTKSNMTRVSDNNYTVVVDTSDMGAGSIKYIINVILPDGRREIIKGTTSESIVNGLH